MDLATGLGAFSWFLGFLSGFLGLRPLHFFGEHELESVPPSALEDPGALERWTLRVRGISGPLHLFWHADALWSGELVIPLAEAVARERELAGPRGRGPIVWSPRG